MTIRIDVRRDSRHESAPADDFIVTWVSRAVAAGTDAGNAEVSVRIVDADEINALNREYRSIDRPTNVLSFPAGQVAGLPAAEAVPLGDIVVCADVVADEAGQQGKTVTDHWAHMLVHGALHLLGYDHEVDDDARTMEALERRILTREGLPDPYGAARQNC